MTAEEVFASEEVIEGLRAPLSKLSKSMLNLRFPDEQSFGVFASDVRTNDLSLSEPAEKETLLDMEVSLWHWPIGHEFKTTAPKELSLWKDFLASVDFFHHFKFYNIKGSFENDANTRYLTETGFKGLAQLRSGTIAAVKGHLDITWDEHALDSQGEKSEWRISEMSVEELGLVESERPFFVDVIRQAFDEEARDRLLRAPSDELMIGMVLGVATGELDLEAVIAQGSEMMLTTGGNYPLNQIAVVDIDRDGYDDFYYTAYDDRAFFFRNRGDGSFEEISERLGLDLEKLHGAFFADFDNDGDSDAFVTYFSREDGTHYLRNENGRFVERNDLVDAPLPGWTMAISAADYDNDGLLDVYLGRYAVPYITYTAAYNEAARNEGRAGIDRFLYMGDEESRELFERVRAPDANPYLNAPGPPNILLKNQGDGRFVLAPGSDTLVHYYNTLATAWSDFDRDGDMDIYVTNELGPNFMMRNRGDGTFEDISDEVTREVGFAMGASWGDYDNDGQSDVYVTNMFSKAGKRIAEQMHSGEGIVKSARGNTLMRNSSDGFIKVSGLEAPSVLVEAADFSWGAAFVDLNNDGALDLYVPAGGISAPKEVATIGDA